MKIAVISDTHSLPLPSKLIEVLPTVDLIIHAGDICDADTLKFLQKIKPVKAVQGNMCDMQLKKKLPLKEIVDVDGIQIGIHHGHAGIKDALGNAQAQFADDPLDVVVFGHSHQALHKEIGGVLYFNPGSPNDVIKAKFFSYGLIEILNGKLRAEIIKI